MLNIIFPIAIMIALFLVVIGLNQITRSILKVNKKMERIIELLEKIK